MVTLIDNWKFVPPNFRWRTVDGDGAVYYWQHCPQFIRHLRRWWPAQKTHGSARTMCYGGRLKMMSMEQAQESLQERPS